MDKWYKRNAGIVTLLVLFFPVGLYLMWRYARWSRAAKWIVTGVIIACGIASQINRVPTNSSTIAVQPPFSARDALTASAPSPAPVPAWKTTHSYSGNGVKKTEIIQLSSDWKLTWSCDPASDTLGFYNVIITVYGADGSMKDLAINTICKSSNTSGETEEHVGGQVYLDIDVGGAWNVTVQER